MSERSFTYVLPGQDDERNGIVITYSSWGPMWEWKVETWVAYTLIYQHVTNANGELYIEYRRVDGTRFYPAWAAQQIIDEER
jgi:hypothetical protein